MVRKFLLSTLKSISTGNFFNPIKLIQNLYLTANLIVEVVHPGYAYASGVHTDSQPSGQQPPGTAVEVLLIMAQGLLEDPDMVCVEEDINLVPAPVLGLDDADVVRHVSHHNAPDPGQGEGQEHLAGEVEHEALPARGQAMDVLLTEVVQGPE